MRFKNRQAASMVIEIRTSVASGKWVSGRRNMTDLSGVVFYLEGGVGRIGVNTEPDSSNWVLPMRPSHRTSITPQTQ